MTPTRNDILARARALYIETGQTNNITTAVERYLKFDSTVEERAVWKNETDTLGQLRIFLSKNRPDCDACGAALKLQINKSSHNGKTYPTSFHCEKCHMVYYSDLTVRELAEAMKFEYQQTSRKLQN